MFDLSGKTALVTGATGGLGSEIAKGLHAQGAHVVLSGTREAVLEELARLGAEPGLNVQLVYAWASEGTLLRRYSENFGEAPEGI